MSPKPERETSAVEPGSPQLDKARFAPANRRRLSPPALRTFLAIADLWGLTEEQRLLVLGYPSRSTYHNWCKQTREHGSIALDVDVLTRISLVFGIHQALGILFPTERLGVECAAELRIIQLSSAADRRSILVTSGSQGRLAHRATFPGWCARGHLYAAERDRSGIRALQRFGTRVPVTFCGPCTASGLSSHSLTISTDRAVRHCCDRR